MDQTPLTEAQAATARWNAAKQALAEAKEQRDQAIRKAGEQGCSQTDIVRVTGLTRETIRRITNPEAAEAVRTAQRSAKRR